MTVTIYEVFLLKMVVLNIKLPNLPFYKKHKGWKKKLSAMKK